MHFVVYGFCSALVTINPYTHKCHSINDTWRRVYTISHCEDILACLILVAYSESACHTEVSISSFGMLRLHPIDLEPVITSHHEQKMEELGNPWLALCQTFVGRSLPCRPRTSHIAQVWHIRTEAQTMNCDAGPYHQCSIPLIHQSCPWPDCTAAYSSIQQTPMYLSMWVLTNIISAWGNTHHFYY